MRHADGTLPDLRTALNEAIDELNAPIAHASAALSSVTSQLNALLVWAGSALPPADGTLDSATDTYNQAVTDYIKPGRNVNLYFGNWTDDGVTVPVPRYSNTFTIQWTDKTSHPHEIVKLVRFPNVFQQVPLGRLRDYMEEIILKELRIQYGIDMDPNQ